MMSGLAVGVAAGTGASEYTDDWEPNDTDEGTLSNKKSKTDEENLLSKCATNRVNAGTSSEMLSLSTSRTIDVVAFLVSVATD